MLGRSAHVDTFTRDHLPPPETWPELIFTLPELRYPEVLNCADALLDRWVESGQGDRPCLVTEGETWSYARVWACANQVAHLLVEDLGLVPGNRVLLRGPNHPWLIACWFAVLKAGGVVVTTVPMLRAGELRTIGEMAAPAVALCDARHLDDLEAAAIPGATVVPYGGGGMDDLARRAARLPEWFPNVRTAATDVCMLAFTSGTTGRPKATMHFHRDVLAIADTFSRRVLRPGPGDLFTGSPPLGFTFGLGGLLVFPMRAGAATLLLERAGPEQLLEAIRRHPVTTLFTAPTAIRAMLPMLEEGGVGRLRSCVTAGETLPAATWTAFHDRTGIRIIDGLGSTEMLHIFVASPPEETRPGLTGRVVPGYVAEVQDEEGRPLPDGEEGHLAVKGPTGCRYLRGDRQGEYVRRGWNLTGDVYVREPDGFFRYRARADDMIISAGYNIAGPEVEEALLRHPDVAEAAVVGLPDEERGMVVAAYVVLRPGRPRTPDRARALQDFVKAEIAPYKYPRRLEFVDELPRSPTGKLQRFRLRHQGSG
ncbi:MAG TPA: AMP-binding protein [Candidatus Dormibacteraeota bacterium]|nr:AMP-binding protein [Candidatus Dormibacteraeota bacterium]